MSIVVQNCGHCGQAFLPMVENGQAERFCPACLRQAQTAMAPREAAPVPEPPPPARFAPLSALPPDRRPVDRRQQPPPAQPAPPNAMLPRQLPGMADPKAQRPTVVRQIGFNCPSCMVILIIKQPEDYDGRAAPCPHCGTVILPPRIAPPSPFTVISAPKAGLPLPPKTQLVRPATKTAPVPLLPAPGSSDSASESDTRRNFLPPARNLAKAALI